MIVEVVEKEVEDIKHYFAINGCPVADWMAFFVLAKTDLHIFWSKGNI